MKRRGDSGKRRLPRGVLFAGLAGLALLAGLGAFRVVLDRRLEGQVGSLREAGFPMTPAELAERYPVPEGPTAATALAEAGAAISDAGDERFAAVFDHLPIVGSGDFPEVGELPGEATLDAIRTYLDANRKPLARLHEAATLRVSRYPLDLNSGARVDVQHLLVAREVSYLLYLEAADCAARGDVEGTANAVRSALVPGRVLAKEPMLISQLVRIAADSIAADCLERVVNLIALDSGALAMLEQAFQTAEDPDSMRQALVGERAIFGHVLRTGGESMGADFGRRRVDAPGGGAAAIDALYTASGVRALDSLKYLEMFQEAIEVVSGSPEERLEAIEAVARSFDGPRLAAWFAPVTCSVARTVQDAMAKDLSGVARLRTARVALAVERFRLAGGRLPESLEDLEPQLVETVPADPFDGQLLRYREVEGGFVVWSVGPDRADEGGFGIDPSGNVEAAGDDVSFRVLRR